MGSYCKKFNGKYYLVNDRRNPVIIRRYESSTARIAWFVVKKRRRKMLLNNAAAVQSQNAGWYAEILGFGTIYTGILTKTMCLTVTTFSPALPPVSGTYIFKIKFLSTRGKKQNGTFGFSTGHTTGFYTCYFQRPAKFSKYQMK